MMALGRNTLWGNGFRALRGEMASLAAVVGGLAGEVLRRPSEDAPAPAPSKGPPVMLVHGLFGDPTNFGTLRQHLERRGLHRFASFAYLPQLDVPRLATALAVRIDACCSATGAPQVDVVGHSLGGLVARYLVASGHGRRVRRVVTLGAPAFIPTTLQQEFTIYGAYDALVPPPAIAPERGGRSLVLPDCGHLGLLTHPQAVSAAARWLLRPVLVARAAPLAA